MAENNTLELAKKVKKAQDENRFNGIKSLQELSDDFLNDLEQQEEQKKEDKFNYSPEKLSLDDQYKQDKLNEDKASDISTSPSQIANILPENNIQIEETQPMAQNGPTIENEQKLIETQRQAQNQPIEANSERNIVPTQPENQISEYERGLNAALDIRQKKNAQMMSQTLNEKAELENKINEAKKNIDGANIMKSGTIGQKILAGLAVFLGGLGGSKNIALEILQDQENKVISQNKDLLDKYTKQLGDISKAEIAIKSDFYDALEEKTMKMAEIAHPSQKLKYQELISGIQEKRMKMDSQLLEMTQKQMLSRGGKLTEEMARTLPEEDKKKIVRDPKTGKLLGLADTAEQKKKFDEVTSSTQRLEQSINKIEGLIKKYGTREVLDRGAVREEGQTRREIQLILKDFYKLGVLTGPDMGLLEDVTGKGFFDVTTSDASKKATLEGLKRSIENAKNVAARQAGVQQVGSSSTFRSK